MTGCRWVQMCFVSRCDPHGRFTLVTIQGEPIQGESYVVWQNVLACCSNQSPFNCSSARPPKQARHAVRVDTWLHLTMCFRAAAGVLVSQVTSRPPWGGRAPLQAQGLWIDQTQGYVNECAKWKINLQSIFEIFLKGHLQPDSWNPHDIGLNLKCWSCITISISEKLSSSCRFTSYNLSRRAPS